jgi:hypothetical protein
LFKRNAIDMNRLRLEFDWHNTTPGGVHFDIINFAQAVAPNSDVKRRVIRSQGSLWAGLFGVFDVLRIVPVTSTVRCFETVSVGADSTTTSKLGIRKESVDTIDVYGGSPQTTAALAYLAKLTAASGTSAPNIRVMNARSKTNKDTVVEDGVIITPVDVLGKTLTIRALADTEGHRRPGRYCPNIPSSVMGSLCVYAQTELTELPLAVAYQTSVIKYWLSPDASAGLYSLFGATGDDHLSNAWSAAMSEKTPSDAAQTAIRELE